MGIFVEYVVFYGECLCRIVCKFLKLYFFFKLLWRTLGKVKIIFTIYVKMLIKCIEKFKLYV